MKTVLLALLISVLGPHAQAQTASLEPAKAFVDSVLRPSRTRPLPMKIDERGHIWVQAQDLISIYSEDMACPNESTAFFDLLKWIASDPTLTQSVSVAIRRAPSGDGFTVVLKPDAWPTKLLFLSMETGDVSAYREFKPRPKTIRDCATWI